MNTHGGLLSERYRRGLGNTIEAVRQICGDGFNQVDGAELILTTGQGGPHGAAVILRR